MTLHTRRAVWLVGIGGLLSAFGSACGAPASRVTAEDGASGDARDGGITDDTSGSAEDGASGDARDGGVTDNASAHDGAAASFEICRLLGLGTPTSMQLSSNGKLVAYGSREGGITILEFPAMRALRTITAHAGKVTAVGFSPDDSLLISGDEQGAVAIWNPASGVATWRGQIGTGPVQAIVSAHPSGGTWVLAGDGVRGLDLLSGSVSPVLAGTASCASVAVGGGGAMALSCSDGALRIFDTTTSQLVTAIAAHQGAANSVAMSVDGTLLVTGGEDGTVALWSDSGALVRRFAKPGAAVRAVDLDAQGTNVLALSGDTAWVWKASDGTAVTNLGWVLLAALSDDGTNLVAANSDPLARRQPLDGSSGASWTDRWTTAEFSPDGTLVAEADTNDVVLWDTRDGRVVNSLHDPELMNWAYALAFSSDGKTLGRSSVGSSLRVFDTTTGAILQRLTGAPSGCRSLVFSPDDAWLVSPSDTGVSQWSVADGSLRTVAGTSTSTAVAYARDGQRLAVGDGSGGVALWDATGTTRLLQWSTGTRAVTALAFSPDGQRLAVGVYGDVGSLWTVAGIRLGDLSSGAGTSLSFSADGELLVSLAPLRENGAFMADGSAVVLSGRDGHLLAVADQNPKIVGGATVRFAPKDNRILVTGIEIARILCPAP